MRNGNLLKSHVSEIRVKRIHVNQGGGLYLKFWKQSTFTSNLIIDIILWKRTWELAWSYSSPSFQIDPKVAFPRRAHPKVSPLILSHIWFENLLESFWIYWTEINWIYIKEKREFVGKYAKGSTLNVVQIVTNVKFYWGFGTCIRLKVSKKLRPPSIQLLKLIQ